MKTTLRTIEFLLAASFCWIVLGLGEIHGAEPSATGEIADLEKKLAEAQALIEKLTAEKQALERRLEAGGAPNPKLGGLDSEDPAAGREAVRIWAEKGTAALEELRQIAVGSSSAVARHRAKEALGQITGQWGSQTDLVWKRSVKDAINPDKPIIVLQLFGSLDEEFC